MPGDKARQIFKKPKIFSGLRTVHIGDHTQSKILK
jgi:hypothetical protein